ncbi:DUF1510 family protein [Bacillus gobiensis]|uniref:YrrS family protein n=1 Tax=Bacillus gobiensis TaxID=1441095 RepID=UPI003D1E5146
MYTKLEENRSSRYEKQDKRRKANFVLNILIGIVAILIVLVASQLLRNPPSNEQATTNQENELSAPASDDKNQSGGEDSGSNDNSNETANDQDDQADKDNDEGNSDKSDSDDPFAGAKVTEGGSSSDVEQTIVNPEWKAVGTEQTGDHVATYDDSSKDWAEMLKAMSYATGVSEDKMTVVWLGNNGGPQDAKGTIKDKESGEKYKVEITWEDGNGWKPTKVEKLKS